MTIEDPNPTCQNCGHEARNHGVSQRAADGTPRETVCWVDRCECSNYTALTGSLWKKPRPYPARSGGPSA